MSTQITDDTMTSSTTRHHAERLPEGWRVSWLPDRRLDRNQAVTAMTIAEAVAANVLTSQHPKWVHVDQWAAELDLTGPAAVSRIASVDPDTMRPFFEEA